MENKKTGCPFPSGNPAIRLRADPQLSVSRLLGIWLYHRMIEKALKMGLPATPKALFYCFGKFASIAY